MDKVKVALGEQSLREQELTGRVKDLEKQLKRLQPLVDNLPRTIKALKELKKLKKKG